MALFLAGLVDQLDLALEHISKGGLHNSRIGLMLTDNVLELVLFQIVKSKQSEAMRWRSVGPGYAYSTQLRKALLGSFSDKIDFAKLEGALEAEKARTFNIMHHYRNDIYHAGLAHEAILPSLARFYFEVTCLYVGSFDARCLSWTSGQQMPDRARKYFGDRLSGVTRNNFAEVCDKLAMASGHDDSDLVAILAEHLEEIIGNVDTCVQIVANGVYKGQEMSRDAAVIETQAWELAFDEKGRSFASERGFVGSAHGLVDFLLGSKLNQPLENRWSH